MEAVLSIWLDAFLITVLIPDVFKSMILLLLFSFIVGLNWMLVSFLEVFQREEIIKHFK